MNHQAAASTSRDNPGLGLVGFDILQKEWNLFLQEDAHASPVLLYTSFGCRQGEMVISLSPQTSTLLAIHKGKKEIFFIPAGPQKPPWIPQNHIELPTTFSYYYSFLLQNSVYICQQWRKENLICCYYYNNKIRFLSTVQRIPVILWVWFTVPPGKDLIASSSILLFLTLHQNTLIWHYVRPWC